MEGQIRGASCEPGEDFDLDLVEYVVITMPELGAVAALAAALRAVVQAALVRVLDLVVVEDVDGRPRVVEIDDMPELAPLQEIEGQVGGLLGEVDLDLASSALPRGSCALVLVLEDRWASPLAEAARAQRGRVAGGERISSRRVRALAGADLGRMED